MARFLTLKLEDFELKTKIAPFSRDSIYGRKLIEKRGEDGSKYKTVYLTEEGTLIVVPGATGTDYFTEEGNYVKKVVIVDEEEKEIPITYSMFKSSVDLKNTISIEQYFNYDIERSYVLQSDNQEELTLLLLECQIMLESNLLMKFPYAYYDTIEKRDAILVPKEDKIVMLVGVYTEPEFISVTEIEYEEEEEEVEEEEEEQGEIDFDIW